MTAVLARDRFTAAFGDARGTATHQNRLLAQVAAGDLAAGLAELDRLVEDGETFNTDGERFPERILSVFTDTLVAHRRDAWGDRVREMLYAFGLSGSAAERDEAWEHTASWAQTQMFADPELYFADGCDVDWFAGWADNMLLQGVGFTIADQYAADPHGMLKRAFGWHRHAQLMKRPGVRDGVEAADATLWASVLGNGLPEQHSSIWHPEPDRVNTSALHDAFAAAIVGTLA